MSNAVPSLLLVGIKPEEANAEEECALRPYKVDTSVRSNRPRPCSQLISQYEPACSESDCASSIGEWQPPPPQTSPTLSSESKTPLLLPSAMPTGELNTTNMLSSSTNMLTTGVVLTPNTSEPEYPKYEPKELSRMKRIDELEGENRLKAQPHECDICGKVFSTNTTMNRHIETIHKGLRPFACEICGKNFKDSGHLRKHIDSIHKTLRPFPCEFCDSCFAERSNLRRHVDSIHKELRQHICEVCGKAFGEKTVLKRHINSIHEDLREHICGVCGKAFGRRTVLKRHINSVHKRVRPFECDFCDRKFKEADTLKHHIDCVHRALRPFPCEFCDSAFGDRSNLRRHIGSVHKEST